MRLRTLLTLSLAAAMLLGVSGAHAQREKLPPDDYELVKKTWPGIHKTNAGIRYIVLKPAEGPKPKAGNKVSVLYKGTLLQGGKMFDQNQDAQKPFVFRVDRGMVIHGWDQILQMMSVGSKWMVIIPPELAYGSRGQPPTIPRDATLVFEIELLKIED
jgi:FKBP-type peptidyl-prolyl cis-trans isomerase